MNNLTINITCFPQRTRTVKELSGKIEIFLDFLPNSLNPAAQPICRILNDFPIKNSSVMSEKELKSSSLNLCLEGFSHNKNQSISKAPYLVS